MSSRLQIAVIAGLVAMVMLLMTAGVFAGKIMMDGLTLRRTRIAVEFVRMSWRHRNYADVGFGLLNSASKALEGGLRLQMSNYFLDRSDELQAEGLLSEAARSCIHASSVLGRYDTGELYEECANTFWNQPSVDYWQLAAGSR